MFKHPLENPSLAPLGLTTELSYSRLHWRPTGPFMVFVERMSARFWEKRNRADALRPLPVETIIHRIMPSMAQRNRIAKGDFVFEGKPYLTRDIVTLSSAVQWFGTNVGSCFINEPLHKKGRGYHPSREFIVKLAQENEQKLDACRPDMYTHLTHRCTGRCKNSCVYDSRTVTDRDKAVVDALMRWLGTAHGRQYLEQYRVRQQLARESASCRERRHRQRKRKTA